MAAPRGATSVLVEEKNRLYAINSRQEKKDSLNVVTFMIHVFDFTVYIFVDPQTSLSFVTLYFL